MNEKQFTQELANAKDHNDIVRLLEHPALKHNSKENDDRISLLVDLLTESESAAIAGQQFKVEDFVPALNTTPTEGKIKMLINTLASRINPIKASSGFIAKTKSTKKEFSKIEILTRQGKHRGE